VPSRSRRARIPRRPAHRGVVLQSDGSRQIRAQIRALRRYTTLREIPGRSLRPSGPDRPNSCSATTRAITLTGAERATFDAAMKMTDDKRTVCCHCWRWYMTEGLDKFLINAPPPIRERGRDDHRSRERMRRAADRSTARDPKTLRPTDHASAPTGRIRDPVTAASWSCRSMASHLRSGRGLVLAVTGISYATRRR